VPRRFANATGFEPAEIDALHERLDRLTASRDAASQEWPPAAGRQLSWPEGLLRAPLL
jgi:hypothetical protein